MAAGLAFSADLDAAMVRSHVGVPGVVGVIFTATGCATRLLASSPLSVQPPACLLLLSLGSPQGRTGVSTQRSKLKQLSAPWLSVATPTRRGRRAKPEVSTGLWIEPTRCAVRLPPRAGYAAIATAGRGALGFGKVATGPAMSAMFAATRLNATKGGLGMNRDEWLHEPRDVCSRV
jgi:hypothetical protein